MINSLNNLWSTISEFFVEDVHNEFLVDGVQGIWSDFIKPYSNAYNYGLQTLVESDSDRIDLQLVRSVLTTVVPSYSEAFDNILDSFEQYSFDFVEIQSASDLLANTSEFFSTMGEFLVGEIPAFKTLTQIGDVINDALLSPYIDGVTETSYGSKMEQSWSKASTSFLQAMSNGSSRYAVNVYPTTPFDSGIDGNNIYGKMMLGVPPLFNTYSDPLNRSIMNTFLRDAKFLSLTPGFPKYNGSLYLQNANDTQYAQTNDADSMMEYLLSNGLDKNFANKDRRYYTFEVDYEDYYAYLETMLNTLHLKLGLSSDVSGENNFNIFSFFDILKDNKIDASGANTLKSQYNNSMSFFVNPSGSLAENITNSNTHFGSEAKNQVDSRSEEFQRIEYLSGMGTGSAAQKAAAIGVKGIQNALNIGSHVSSVMSNTISALTASTSVLTKLATVPLGAVKDTAQYLTTNNPGADIQSFAVTNGMKVMYPELWSDSNYSRSINLNLEFTSPYGDPASIFKYVYAPFCALACFAMPRQAADNGLVSPFFIRADIPGYFTADLALISDFTWTKGGSADLWTKDGLPRSISCTLTITDLYPFLAMTKRLSFLSANPNYTVWLDNIAGLHALYDEANESGLNDYWKAMINRVNGESGSGTIGLWNKYNSAEANANKYAASNEPTISINNKLKVPWLRNI